MASLADSLSRDGDEQLWNMFMEYVDTVRSGARPVEVSFSQPVYRVLPALLGACNADGDDVAITLDTPRPGFSRSCEFGGRAVDVQYECRPGVTGTTVVATISPRIEQNRDQIETVALVAAVGDQLSNELFAVRERLDAQHG
jgi:hypothetical protein